MMTAGRPILPLQSLLQEDLEQICLDLQQEFGQLSGKTLLVTGAGPIGRQVARRTGGAFFAECCSVVTRKVGLSSTKNCSLRAFRADHVPSYVCDLRHLDVVRPFGEVGHGT